MMGLTIGLLGGGQLGQMLILAGLPLGLRFVVWDPDPGSPAGKLSTKHFCAPYDSSETLKESLGFLTWSYMNSRIFLILWLQN